MDALTGWPDARRMEEVEALLLLEALPGVGPRTVQRLLRAAGSGVRALSDRRLLLERVGAEAAAAAARPGLREGVLRGLSVARRLGMGVLSCADPAYPATLRQLADPPSVLFLRGDPALLTKPGVGVVGARKATARARQVAYDLGLAVARTGTPVVSGLALGVDGAAHRGALEGGGATVAVLGTGPDRAYPSSHRRLFDQIVDRGLLVSEFLPGTPALPHHFPRRNRILAALSSDLVVVEAGARSGALISVDHALDLGVEVWAVPGPFGEPACAGSNDLLAEGARPLTSVARFIEALGIGQPPGDPPAPPLGPAGIVLESLRRGARSADELARATGLPVGTVLGLLSALELQGRVTRLPGMRFREAG